MKKILLLLAVFTAAAYGSGSDLRVIESAPQAITLEFTPSYNPAQTITSGNSHFDLLNFKGGRMDVAAPGMPDMRYLSVPIALPGRDGAQVDVLSADFESVAGFNQAPVPKVGTPSEKNPSGLIYAPNYPVGAGLYPAESAAIENISPMHGGVIGYLRLNPVQYDPASGSLKKCTRMTVRLTYGERDSRFTSSDAAAWAPIVLNSNMAMAWYGKPVPRLAKKTAINSVRASGQWFKMEVADEGMVKIDAPYLKAQGVDPSSLSSIRDIKVYGGNGLPLSESLSSAIDADLSQCAVKYVDNNGNGKFDADDYVLFYARGPNGWIYNYTQNQYGFSYSAKSFTHVVNPFTTSNYYLMQISSGAVAKEMQTLAPPAAAPAVVTNSTGMIFFDEDKVNFNQSGQIWVGPPMSDKSSSRSIANKLTGYMPGTPVTYNYDFYAQAQLKTDFVITESSAAVGTATVDDMTLDEINSAEGDYANESTGTFSVVPPITDERSNVKITYVPKSNTSLGFINWLEILYQKQLTASADELDFVSPDMNGSVQYPVSGFTTNAVMGFDVTDINNVKTIDMQLQQQMGSFTFGDNLQAGSVKKYWIGASTAFKPPKSTVRLPNTNLHGAAGADFVIITHHDFIGEAQRLKTQKETYDSLTTMVVDVDTVYNEFGNGMSDPTAIRNFLYYAYERWDRTPKYVLLYGDASYDYRGIASSDKGWVPTYETVRSNNRVYSYCKDDYFVNVDSLFPAKAAMSIGRIAVRSVEEARFFADRIIHYELNSARDSWKNTITIVADDQWVGPSDPPEYEHTTQAEVLAQSYTPPLFDIKKIYIADYATIYTPQGRRKPEARQAIIDQVNRGTLVLNFTGHGNPTVWAHEAILTLEDTKTQFFNNDRLTFVCAATCDWGRFDQTTYQSSAEEMMRNQNGGAIGVLSAVRAVYSADNAALNTTFYSQEFPNNLFARSPRLGDAMVATKNSGAAGDPDNTAKYHLLGDPTLRLGVPAMAMNVDSINGTDAASASPVTLSALQKVTVKASVRKADRTVDQSVNGTALVTVYDADQNKLLPDYLAGQNQYILPGAVLYKGENSVVNGKMEATFMVPKDIAYQNRNGKISLYLSTGTNDGRGYTSNFLVGGTAGSPTADTQGPAMSIYFDSPSFKSGDVVGDEPKLIVALSDSNGINSAGTGIGHRIEAWLDNSAKSIDLTDYYKSKRDSYQEGTVEYPMSKLDPGTHTITVKAWDVYNNPTSADVSFVVTSGSSLSLVNVYNIPNPVSHSTTFTFEHNQLSPLDVQIKVYSVAGRLIAQIDQYALPDRFVQIPWDCRDNDGDPLGNGVYFYRIVAKTTDGRFSSEALGKLAVVR